MNTVLLDEMINYIEAHLREEIDIKKLAQITGLPSYILQRIFSFITDMSISEYIRKRRLSKAYEDLFNKEANITKIAFTYGYASNSSFSRAFKNYFGILPKEVKSQKTGTVYPKIVFAKNIVDSNPFQYQIKKIDPFILYGEAIEITDENYVSEIYQFYNHLKEKGLLKTLKENTWYGATIIENGKTYYFVGSKKPSPPLKELKITNERYILLSPITDEQRSIVDTEMKFHDSYLPSTNYEHFSSKLYELEIYNQDKCTIAIPIN